MNRKLLDCTIYVTYFVQWLIIALRDPRIPKVIYSMLNSCPHPLSLFPPFFTAYICILKRERRYLRKIHIKKKN